MLFCQHRYNTWNRLGGDWLSIHDTPHYAHLFGDDDYYNYLKFSWRGRQNEIHAQIRKYDALFKDVEKNGIKNPIEIVKRFNGDNLIFHGNHRYAIARYLGIEYETKELSIEEYIKFNITNKKSRFGTNQNDVPYQSIYYNGKCLVEGRRKDQLERHALIDKSDLKGKRVFDFGCNIGASAVLAHEDGAKVEGWDLQEFRTSAIRLAVLMNYDIKYRRPKGEYDTLFLFSTMAHANIPEIDAKVIYVETHEDNNLPDRFIGAEKMGELGKRSFWRYVNDRS